MDNTVLQREKFIYWLEHVGAHDHHVIGNKSANLGEIFRAGARIPRGFAISADCNQQFLERWNVQNEINQYLNSQKNLENIEKLIEVSKTLRNMVEEHEIPQEHKDEIIDAYRDLCETVAISDGEIAVAVRSSALNEDTIAASFAGQFETFLNIFGEEALLNCIKKVWSSIFTVRALSYRMQKKLPLEKELIGVTVLEMIDARSSGICFTADPVTCDPNRIIIEANFGLGEGVVGGTECVDTFVVDKETMEIVKSYIGRKIRCVVKKNQGVQWIDVPDYMRHTAAINNDEVKEIARLAKLVEAQFGAIQDIEWSIDANAIFPKNVVLLQARPANIRIKKPKIAVNQLVDLFAKKFRLR